MPKSCCGWELKNYPPPSPGLAPTTLPGANEKWGKVKQELIAHIAKTVVVSHIYFSGYKSNTSRALDLGRPLASQNPHFLIWEEDKEPHLAHFRGQCGSNEITQGEHCVNRRVLTNARGSVSTLRWGSTKVQAPVPPPAPAPHTHTKALVWWNQRRGQTNLPQALPDGVSLGPFQNRASAVASWVRTSSSSGPSSGKRSEKDWMRPAAEASYSRSCTSEPGEETEKNNSRKRS